MTPVDALKAHQAEVLKERAAAVEEIKERLEQQEAAREERTKVLGEIESQAAAAQKLAAELESAAAGTHDQVRLFTHPCSPHNMTIVIRGAACPSAILIAGRGAQHVYLIALTSRLCRLPS